MHIKILMVIFSTIIFTPPATEAAIWGADNRQESSAYSASTFERKTSESVALLVPWERLTSTASGVKVDFSTYAEESLRIEERLCARERFQNQPGSIYKAASGFLVSPDMLVTAGHVIETDNDCTERAVVFGYQWDERTQTAPPIPQENIFSCRSVIKSVLQEDPLLDYAILQLDRPARQIKPLPIRRTGIIPVETVVAMAGHPFGLPMKITNEGLMRDNTPVSHFVAFLDTYPGNSGSPVVDPRSGLVEGVLVEGEGSDTTLEGDWPEGCWYSKVYCDPAVPFAGACDDYQGSGAKVIRTTVFADFIP